MPEPCLVLTWCVPTVPTVPYMVADGALRGDMGGGEEGQGAVSDGVQ